jgi:hypothetical protein
MACQLPIFNDDWESTDLERVLDEVSASSAVGVALPLSFWLERRMASQSMAPDNPLRPLSIQMA